MLWIFEAHLPPVFTHFPLWSCAPSSVYGALLVPLPPPQPSNLLTAPPQPFGSSMMASSPLHVITIYVVSSRAFDLKRTKIH